MSLFLLLTSILVFLFVAFSFVFFVGIHLNSDEMVNIFSKIFEYLIPTLALYVLFYLLYVTFFL